MRRDARPGAALLLAAALVALPLARGRGEARPCERPAERTAVGGHSRAVGCDGGAALRGPARLLFGLRLDPDIEDAAALEALPGVGPARARAIVAARCPTGFAEPRDLERVRGIGPVTRAQLAAWLAFDPGSRPDCAAP